MQSKFDLTTIIAIGAIVFGLFGNQITEFVSNLDLGGGASVPGEQFPGQPTDSKVTGAVEAVKQQLASADKGDKIQLARLWREFGRLIQLDQGIIKSTSDIRKGHGTAGKLMALGIQNRYPGLAKNVDNALFDILGNDPKALDGTTRGNAVAVFNGLSWAALQ